MPKYEDRAKERIAQQLAQYGSVLRVAGGRGINESDTAAIVKDMLGDVLGYDKYLDVTSEYQIRGKFADFVVKRDDKPLFAVECKAVKAFLFERFYNSPGILEYTKRGQEVVRFLFHELLKKPSLIPEKFSVTGEEVVIQVKDHIASMTDDYAMDLYDKLHWKAFSRLEI